MAQLHTLDPHYSDDHLIGMVQECDPRADETRVFQIGKRAGCRSGRRIERLENGGFGIVEYSRRGRKIVRRLEATSYEERKAVDQLREKQRAFKSSPYVGEYAVSKAAIVATAEGVAVHLPYTGHVGKIALAACERAGIPVYHAHRLHPDARVLAPRRA